MGYSVIKTRVTRGRQLRCDVAVGCRDYVDLLANLVPTRGAQKFFRFSLQKYHRKADGAASIEYRIPGYDRTATNVV